MQHFDFRDGDPGMGCLGSIQSQGARVGPASNYEPLLTRCLTKLRPAQQPRREYGSCIRKGLLSFWRYPGGLAGVEIPLSGRIVALADVYDALTTKRIYKPAFSHEKAAEMIRDGRALHFDPDIVDAFEVNQERFAAILDEFAHRDGQEIQAIAERQAALVLS